MRLFKTAVLTASLLAGASYASALDLGAICCDGGFEYRHPSAWEKEQQRLRNDLAAAQKQLADRDRELASLRASGGDSSKLASQLSSTQGELDLAKGRISDLEKSLAAAGAGTTASQFASGDKDKLAAELAAANNDKDKLAGELTAANNDKSRLAMELATLRGSAGDKDKLADELAAANNDKSRLAMELAALRGSAGDKDKLAAELSAANRRITDLEKQLADRDRELAGLRGDLSAEMAKLKEAERGLIKALRPQIEKGTIMVDLNNERLLINLASGYLFGSGEDQLKPAGADALKQVGGILKDFPEYKVAVDGHTDNRPIRSALKKKFPTNKELSEARAANAAQALAEGGLGGATTHGYADTKPVAPNKTDADRAKNRRVEVRVTK